MDIKVTVEDAKATIAPVGKLTVQTAPELDGVISKLSDQIMDLSIDLSALDYISSAGLRVLVSAQKMMSSRGGNMRLLSPTDDVYDVFEMTGLSEVLTIER